MKKVIIALATLIATVASYGQGTVQFNNRLTASGIDAKILSGGVGISDAAFKAQLYAGPEGSALSALKAVPGTTSFRTGAGAGYISPIDVSIPGIAAGAKATIVVRAYNGATYETSTSFGTSNPITITLGGAGSPPGPGAELVGLTGFSVAGAVIPEPSTIALGALGAAALLLRRRK